MESYHLGDMYSMYVAGQLLWDPDREPDELLKDVTEAIWGPRNGPKVLTAIHLIEDVRSARWDLSPNSILGTVDPTDDLLRAEHSLAELQDLETDQTFVPKFPLPFASVTLVDVMLPHLRQIRDFSAWRVEFNDVRKRFEDGVSKEQTVVDINRIWRPVPGYNTWTGTYGPLERKCQEVMIRNFAHEAKISVSSPGWLQFDDANCALQCFRNKQILSSAEWCFSAAEANSGLGADWALEKMNECLKKLVADGCLEIVGNDLFRLANWQDYAHWPRNRNAY